MVFQCGKEVGKSSFSSVDIMCVHLMLRERKFMCFRYVRVVVLVDVRFKIDNAEGYYIGLLRVCVYLILEVACLLVNAFQSL